MAILCPNELNTLRIVNKIYAVYYNAIIYESNPLFYYLFRYILKLSFYASQKRTVV